MENTKSSGNNAAASMALLFVVIAVSVLLRTTTDLSSGARGIVSVLSGVTVAVIVFTVTSRRSRS